MDWLKDTLVFETRGKGMYLITNDVQGLLTEWKVQEGQVTLFVPHTSASLALSESYDPDARMDVEQFFERIAPENQTWYRHTTEGSDDSPSHMRAVISHNSLNIPVDQRKLSLGVWQGIYLFEHRHTPMHRKILVRCLKVT
ncbi:MAG: YjbQ family protein [Leptolinea sp.]|jgi:secondary thiamine-phosphate synthase enzyme|nr:YjbQ family protein [Leptolinea sp.]